ncbi:uracil-DNA glycosylase family protein [Chromobacterium sp. IIBBL 290-4]|uniref:uracil-DNA glycosylase n=1 Tax=Chromobacterium sp. IIBBL 290-4 TaxID=2953890 RepID=UPI0020B75B09|nr:uracil-DNA glycosylase [Chromobacterium sp. IIBBL 290-4]UTH72651.1 uracil-DNA glycosylase [Chromobacterium sp. IIBBL 290-4]
MSRSKLLQQSMGLGPTWLPRDGRFDQHPGELARQAWLAEAQAKSPPHAFEAPAEAIEPAKPSIEPAQAATAAPDTTAHAPAATPPSTTLRAEVRSELPQLDWSELQQQVADCQQCRLCETRTQTVFGRGNAKARWLLIGEAPGEQEDKQGLPFVGRAGQLLDNMLLAAGLDRDQDVYIANVLKCRPPGNRNPAPDEIAACNGYLLQQIRHIQPTLILALGRFAAQTLLETEDSIGRLRGKVHRYQGVPLVVSYHPAYLLRNQPDKAKAWQDLLLARKVYQHAGG